jgi:hypothetical protein
MANTILQAKEDEKSYEKETAASLLTPSATVEVDLSGPREFPFYRMTILRAKRDIVSKILPAPADTSSRKLSLQVSSKALGTGAFTVSLAGLDKVGSTAQQLGTYHFFVSRLK